MVDKVVISILVLFAYVALFKKASGSLSLNKLNIMNFSFYLLLITSLIGGIAIFLGFREHYVINNLTEQVANNGFYIIAYSLIALPFFSILFNRMMGIRNYGKFYYKYINLPVEKSIKGQKTIFALSLVLTGICFISVAYTLYYVGYIPLLELLKGKFYLLSSGVAISREFRGNTYIRNILALGFTPFFSFFAYINYYYTKDLKWKWMFVILFILSVIIKTYDLSKAPIVIYLFYFYIIQVLVGNAGGLQKFIRYIGIAVGIMLVFYYVALDYSGNLLSFSNGPVSRLMISQIAGLFKHVEIFPSKHAFLNGSSFPQSIAFLTGATRFGERSGRVVMSILYPSGVANNTSGVMNTLFSAEAYANYGVWGVVISPIIVSLCISVIPTFILKQRKTPMNMTLYIMFTYIFTNALIGGFVDFIYNVVLIVLLLIFMLLKFFANGGILHIRK